MILFYYGFGETKHKLCKLKSVQLFLNVFSKCFLKLHYQYFLVILFPSKKYEFIYFINNVAYKHDRKQNLFLRLQ